MAGFDVDSRFANTPLEEAIRTMSKIYSSTTSIVANELDKTYLFYSNWHQFPPLGTALDNAFFVIMKKFGLKNLCHPSLNL